MLTLDLEQILLLGLFVFLVCSMFFHRLGLRFSYRPLIGLTVGVIWLHGVITLGRWNAVIFLLTSLGVGTVIEMIGVKTGWPFGRYHYTDKAGPKIMNRVPLFIPLMWTVIIYMGFWTGHLLLLPWHEAPHAIFQQGVGMKILLVSAGAVMVVLWDLIADPVAVDEGGWVWPQGGAYYGIPLTNFGGWFITALSILAAFVGLAQPVRLPPVGSLDRFLVYLPAFGYVVLMAVFARAALERGYRLAGWIGLCTASGVMILGSLFLLLY